MNDPNVNWQRMSPEELMSHLETNAACGLSRKAARSRFRKSGKNTIFEKKKGTLSHLWKPLVTDPTLWLMLAVAIFAIFLDTPAGGVCAFGLLLLGGGMLFRFLRGAKTLEEKIERYRIPWTCVLRDGKRRTIPSDQVVVGDVLLLSKGDVVPCDCRLIQGENLTVHTLSPDQKNRPVWILLPKDADKIYTEDCEIEHPQFENMLYGGSRMIEGEAVAIAVAIGENSFLGTITDFDVPRERQSAKRNDPCAFLRPYFRLYNLALWILLLLLTVLGVLTLNKDNSVMSLFLSLCALMGCASSAVIQLYFYAILHFAKQACFDAKPTEERVILKGSNTVDALASVTDIFVLGRHGISEGIPHLLRVSTGRGEIELQEGQAYFALQPMCEAYLLLSEQLQRQRCTTHTAPEFDDAVLKREFLSSSDFDQKAMRVRLENVSWLPREKAGDFALEVHTKTDLYRLFFSTDRGAWNACVAYELDGALCHTDAEAFARLDAFYCSATETGGKVITVIREKDGVNTLLGLFSVGEMMQTTLHATLEHLKQSGIRTSFFLSEDDKKTRAYLKSAGLWEEASTLERRTQQKLTLQQEFDRFRVFTGAEEKEILYLMDAIQKKKGKIAVLGSSNEHLRQLLKADVSIAADSCPYHKQSGEEAENEDLPIAGSQNSSRAAEIVRRQADVVVSRANSYTGGLSSLLHAISRTRQARLRIRLLLPFLLSSHLFRLLTVILSTVLGTGLLKGAQILFGGLITEALLTYWILHLPLPKKATKGNVSLSSQTLVKILAQHKQWIPLVSSSVGCVIYAFVMGLIGAMGAGEASLFLFLSSLMYSAIAFIQVIRDFKLSPWCKKALLPILILVLPPLVGIVLRLVFPSVAFFALIGDVTLFSALSLPLCPLIYFLSRLSAIRFFHRTNG